MLSKQSPKTIIDRPSILTPSVPICEQHTCNKTIRDLRYTCMWRCPHVRSCQTNHREKHVFSKLLDGTESDTERAVLYRQLWGIIIALQCCGVMTVNAVKHASQTQIFEISGQVGSASVHIVREQGTLIHILNPVSINPESGKHVVGLSILAVGANQ